MDNFEEATLRLSLEIDRIKGPRYGHGINLSASEVHKIEKLSWQSKELSIKFALYQAITASPQEANQRFRDYFREVNQLPNYERIALLAQGVFWLNNYLDKNRDELKDNGNIKELKGNIYAYNKYLVSELFLEEAEKILSGQKFDQKKIESLISMSYGNRMVELVSQEYANDSYQKKGHRDFLLNLAELHAQCAKLINREDKEKLHFHYRYLKHLEKEVKDSRGREKLQELQKEVYLLF